MNTPNNAPQTIFRKDYTPPSFLVSHVDMTFDLDPSNTNILTAIHMTRNPANADANADIVLYGDGAQLLSLRMNGALLPESAYQFEECNLRILNAPDEVVLDIETLTHPDKNTSLMGLYISNGNFFTQCEAEGFRKITFFPDRPDVMATYTVTLRADKEKYPVLLSNGNLIQQGDLSDGRHYAKWQDPFKKPSYLFALVAAKLVCQEENYTLQSGRNVLLQVWVEEGNLDKTQHAMDSLKNSIRWDETRFGLELDLDRFMIVAVGDFNMGAMENKGLNIFNTKYVLAHPRLATDIDYANIEGVVGHEYFHNWTGNRVTCRDWFQLSLKEGLTVFRDQEFSADMMSSASGHAVNRIDNVRNLRQTQFPEDAGPMAHPVRPDSYLEINNFYTTTIYEKGAEVVRMLQTLLGVDGFRKGMDLYFERHDGQAVTCNDFRAAMADANGRDLTQFERWYSQAGTPRVQATTDYDAQAKVFTLTLTQTCPPTPGQAEKLPFHIPFAIGLLDQQGKDIPLQGNNTLSTIVLELTQTSQTFHFPNIQEKPVPSLLRNFSAPIVLDYAYSDDELLHLFRHDSDAFNRWEASQRLAMQRLLTTSDTLDEKFIEAHRAALRDETLDPAFRELLLTLPSETTIAEHSDVIDPHAIHAARLSIRTQLAHALQDDLLHAYHAHSSAAPYSPDAVSAGKRSLKNIALAYLSLLPASTNLAQTQCTVADNMTDKLAALNALINMPSAGAQALAAFYADYEKEALVIDKWFALQAMADSCDVANVRKLMQHPAFTLQNPNRARSLIFSFCNGNPAAFHAADGSGYQFWAEQVIALDAINPQVAARLARSLERWRKYAPVLQEKMQTALQTVAKAPSLSKDVLEIITKTL